ncbi:MAG: PilZ domain-containing protein [Sedimentisphaerales bacterium]|nr:PilZ domain-containing protein [Sedimentisphaerales bacterium]
MSMGKGDLVPRIITSFDVQLYAEGQKAFCQAWPVNLSETGVCVRLAKGLAVGQQVQLQIQLDRQNDAMPITGRVVWCRSDTINRIWYCGLGFSELDEDQLGEIRSYVEVGTESLVKFLAEFPIFKDFSRDDCREMMKIVTLRELEKKEILYSDGTTDVNLQGLFIVQSGLLNIFKGSIPQLERHLAVVSPGEIFGEITLINEQAHTATVKAVNPSRLIQINKMGFLLVRKKNPYLALKIMDVVTRALAARLGRTTKKLFSPVRF